MQILSNCGSLKDGYCEKLQQVFDQLLKYRMKLLLECFNAKLGIENGSLREKSSDNGGKSCQLFHVKKKNS
jgi:hypothetical protein